MARRILTGPEEAGGQWQTLYCSLVLLLVVFFVMLIAYSAIDRNRLGRLPQLAPAGGEAPAPAVRQAMAALEGLAAAEGGAGRLALTEASGGFKAVLPHPLLFASGEAALQPEALPLLDAMAELARDEGWSLRVEGHTDDRPVATGRFPSNWELSTLRAVTVLRHFQERGVPAHRLGAVGYGEFRPLADNGTEEGRRQNRRIEILFRTER